MLIPISVIYIIIIQCVDGELEPGSSLKPSFSRQKKFWKSPKNNFEFGFHLVGNDGLHVLAISINETMVWTAGENGGIRVDDKASFDFHINGNLVLHSGVNTTLWKTNIGNKSVSSVVMQDDGNFVVKNSSSYGVWESFSNPNDTLLVNQHFYVGQSLYMYDYSLTLERSGNFTLKWRNNITYWNQGSLNGSIALLSSQGILTLSNSSGDKVWMAYNRDYTDASVNNIMAMTMTLNKLVRKVIIHK